MLICPTCGTANPPGSRVCSACGTALAAPPSGGGGGAASGAAHGASGAADGFALARDSTLRGGGYVVGPVLGQGGFGITYKAGDTNLRRFVAIKEFFPFGAGRRGGTVLPTGGMTQAAYEDTKRKFIEEARTLARFSHPGIVRVYGVWEENNTAYMAMEFLEGKTLQKLIDDKGSIPERAAVVHIKAVALALEPVHAAGLIHRDIKPDNICVTDDGRTVLIDFGTARAFASGKTVRQTAMLTPGYAPLEQYGQQARFGSFSDVYALGATLYHCLTGRMPAPATDRVSGVEVPSPEAVNPAISPGVSRAVMHAMQIKATERPQSMAQFIEELERPAAVPPRPTPPPIPGPPVPVALPVAPPMAPNAPSPTPAYGGALNLGGGYSASRVGDGQLVTNAPLPIALSAIWRGFSTFGVTNPSIDIAGNRVVGSTPLDLRSYGQVVTGTVAPDPRGTLVLIKSQSGVPFNLTDLGRSSGEQRGLTEHVEQALLLAPPSGYMPGGLSVHAGASAAPIPASSPYGGGPPIPAPYGGGPLPYGGPGNGYSQRMPTAKGGEVMAYALMSLFCCPLVAPMVWIRANSILADYGPHDPGDKSTVVWARAIGIALTVVCGTLLLFGLLSAIQS